MIKKKKKEDFGRVARNIECRLSWEENKKHVAYYDGNRGHPDF